MDMSFRERKTSTYSALDGLYKVMETIGSGGFSKVKLGVHVLTGDEVAIKVMDKNFLADDIPRVRMEIDAMKELVHQNICRLYQVIETSDKFFLILEYCAGGELFDYIVDNVRLIENEARRFFRQILSAVAYVHDQGFVHRDLKPENFLLDEQENLKLIDFGLCTQQKVDMDELDACCGSPAYAAPELIEGKQGIGSESDMWSMGVLLYVLLCGCLPFEADDPSCLYEKIQTGKYDVPEFLSDESRALIQKLLQIDIDHRATIEDVTEDSWVTKDSNESLSYKSQWTRDFLDDDCVTLLSAYHEKSKEEIQRLLSEWSYDYLTATYLLLLKRKTTNKPMELGSHTLESLRKNKIENLGAEQFDSFCIPWHDNLMNRSIESESPMLSNGVPFNTTEEKSKQIVLLNDKSCQKMKVHHTNHDHLDFQFFHNLEPQSQSSSILEHADKDGKSSRWREDQLGSGSKGNGFPPVSAEGNKSVSGQYTQLPAGTKSCCDQCTGCQGPGAAPQECNTSVRHQKEEFSHYSVGICSQDRLGATRSQNDCSTIECACKNTRCWERKNRCTLLQSHTATGGHHGSRYFHQNLRGKGQRKSLRGHHRHIRRATFSRLVSAWSLTAKHKAMVKRSCMKYALQLDLPRSPAGSSARTAPGTSTLSASQQKILPANPLVSALRTSINHSSSRSSVLTKNHLTRSMSHSRSFDSQLNVLTKINDHGHSSIHTDQVCGSVDAELHRLHLNLETSHLKKHYRKSLLSSIEHGVNRLLCVMTPRQKNHLGPEPQRVMGLHHNIYATTHDCPQTLLHHLRTAMEEKCVPYKEVGYKLRSFLTDEDNKVQLSFELEVVRLHQPLAFGVRRRKLKGDPWYYRRLCESILTAARL